MGFLSSLWHAVSPFVTPIALVLTGWLHAKVTSTPSDAAKAVQLAQLAQDVAAFVRTTFPTLKGQEVIDKIVAILSTIAGVPTTNPAALERAAHGAVAAQSAPTP